MLDTVNYYNFNKFNVFVFLVDASKAFDRVNYYTLFNELLKRDISSFLLRVLMYMYTNQTLKMGTCCITLFYCTVGNGVKQGGVLSPLLFAMYKYYIEKIQV